MEEICFKNLPTREHDAPAGQFWEEIPTDVPVCSDSNGNYRVLVQVDNIQLDAVEFETGRCLGKKW